MDFSDRDEPFDPSAPSDRDDAHERDLPNAPTETDEPCPKSNESCSEPDEPCSESDEPCVESKESYPAWEVETPAARGSVSRSILLVLLCVILSGFAGFGGAWAYQNLLVGGRSTSRDPSAVWKDADLSRADLAELPDRERDSSSDKGAVVAVVRAVQDAVVVIKAKVTTQYGVVGTSTGSGVLISESGLILTCHHVIDGATAVSVTLNSGAVYDATLVGSDERSDVAVIRISPKADESFPYAVQGYSDDLEIGEQVIAIGNPLGTLGNSVTSGIISAKDRVITTSDGVRRTVLQTDTAINLGNSGGGLFNMRGQLIGVVNAKHSATGVEGLSFAIPIDIAYQVETDLIAYGYVRGIVDSGLETLDVTSDELYRYRYLYGIEEVGVYVVGSAYCPDLKNKDRIVSVNGVAVNTTAEWQAVLESAKVGDTVTVRAVRNGNEFTVSWELREYVPEKSSGEIG